MQINYYQWYSKRVGREMGVLRYGHWGPPVIYIPTCGGSHGEFDYYRLQDDVWWFLENGRAQFFCVDSTNMSTWYNDSIHPFDRIHGHIAWENYILEEVLPLVRNLSHNDFVGVMGFSLGAYDALNFICKHPHIFRFALAIGGVYDVREFLDGYHDMDVYYDNPVEYLSNLSGSWYLDRFRHHSRLVLMAGAHDKYLDSTVEMHNILTRQGIVHHYEIWDSPCDHHEYWWKKQLPSVLGRFYA